MSTQAGNNRDLVFCHQCENEWYRDEHGLECPDCHSDVVEIVSAPSCGLLLPRFRANVSGVLD